MSRKGKILLALFLIVIVIGVTTLVRNYAAFSKAYTFKAQGEDFVENGEPEKAIESFNQALEAGYPKYVIYNNLSWAYNEMGQYEKGIEYVEKAHQIEEIDADQCINYGNSYFGLEKYEEAIEKYEMAIQIDEYYSSNIYFKLGMAYFAINDYENAIEKIEKYLFYEPGDLDANIELVNCYLALDNFIKAYNIMEKVVENHPDDFDAYDMKGYVMEFVENRDQVEIFYKKVRAKFPESLEAWLNIGIYYHDLGLYHEAVAAFEEAYETFPEESLVNAWLSSSLSKTGHNEHAIQYAQAAIDMEPSAINYNTMGNILIDQTKYLEAIPYFDKAHQVMDTLEDTYSVNMMYAYLSAKRYQKAIEYGLSVMDDLKDSYQIPEMIAYAYQQKDHYSNAIDYLNVAKKRGMEESRLAYALAENYYLLGDYEQAEAYIDECLYYNLDDYNALTLKATIDLLQSGSENIVRSIIHDHYLYNNVSGAYKHDALNGNDLSYEDTEKLFYSLVKKDDPYSMYIYGDIYDHFFQDTSSSIDMTYINDDTILVNIHFFNTDTDHLFIEFIDEIKDTKDKTLILNVMDNGGGLTETAVNMLDSLLPSVTVCSSIDRMGTSYPYVTCESSVAFKDIYVFINEKSASASELLALALDTFLDNVTIVGQRSHGKGVGQWSFTEPNKKSVYFVVNHYWNVRENNIMGVGIEPDIHVTKPSIETNLTAIGISQ